MQKMKAFKLIFTFLIICLFAQDFRINANVNKRQLANSNIGAIRLDANYNPQSKPGPKQPADPKRPPRPTRPPMPKPKPKLPPKPPADSDQRESGF